ncbi:MAG: glycosyltransferase family 4 protein, partial [Patescibacteria group bacterium]
MKVCYLNHDLKENTGAGRFCLSLIQQVKNLIPETEITVLTSEPAGHSLERPIIRAGVLGFIFSVFKIRRIIKASDIIHALDGWPYGFVALAASYGLKKKIIITAIGSGAVAPLYSFWRKSLLTWAYKKAHRLTAISHHTKKEILKIVPDIKIEVINHGVDFQKFKIKNLKLKIAENLKPYILGIGTLKKRKGYEYSLKAFAEISEKFPNLKYIIVGQGPEKENLKLKIKNLKLENRVIFLENLSEEELIGLYHNAELFILLPQDINKDMEGFGLVFLEAAACGLPVVSSRDSSAEDAVLEGKNGFLVSPQDFISAGEAM